MARKTYGPIVSDLMKQAALRLEFLKENGDFSADIRRLNALPNKTRRELGMRARETEAVSKKWLLPLSLPITEPITFERLWLRLPVGGRMDFKAGEVVITTTEDTDTPAGDLNVLAEKKTRNLLRGTSKKMRRQLSVSRRTNGEIAIVKKRRRFGESWFQLEVFRLAKDGKTFDEIARRLGRPVSSVKSACLVARQKIGDSALPGKRKLHLAKLRRFDFANHKDCPDCNRAHTVDEMCELARLYIDSAHVKIREKVSQTYIELAVEMAANGDMNERRLAKPAIRPKRIPY